MSTFVSLITIFLAMLIHSSMQLVPGIFAIFYHSGLSKSSPKKTDDLSLSFILGSELFTACIFVAVYSIVLSLTFIDESIRSILSWILIGILFIEILAIIFFYYRNGKGSALFISRKSATNLTKHAEQVKKRTDALLLGMFSGVSELPFTLPLFFVVSNEAISLTNGQNGILIIIYIIVTTIPLFIIRRSFRSGLNLADIARFRAKNKLFFKLILAIGYFLIATTLITTGIIK